MEKELWELLIWIEENSLECTSFEKKSADKANYEDAMKLNIKATVFKDIGLKLKTILERDN